MSEEHTGKKTTVSDSVPYLPVYNAHLFFPKFEMRIIHGILCLGPRDIRITKTHKRAM